MSDSKTEKIPINADWFKEQIKRAGLTHRELAEKLDLSNHTVVSHILSGRRRISFSESRKLAQILNVPMLDILRFSGGYGPEDLGYDETKRGALMVTGYANGEFEIFGVPGGGLAGAPTMIPNPMPGLIDTTSPKVSVVHCRTAGSRFEVFDGAYLIYELNDGVAADALGRLCVVVIEDLGILGGRKMIDGTTILEAKALREGKAVAVRYLIRLLKRGYEPGRYNLAYLTGEVAEQGAKVLSASPVLWLRMK